MENYIITVDGVSYEVSVEKKGESDAQPVSRQAAPQTPKAEAPKSEAQKPSAPAKGTEVTTGTTGKVWKVTSKVGDTVKRGDTILILEAMKMEIPVVSPIDGKITSIIVGEGDSVDTGATVATVE